jgi:DNA-nicking Smr family endonuclease
MSRRRVLRPEEEEIWRSVARTVTPMHRPGPSFPLPEPKSVKADTKAPLQHSHPRLPLFTLGEKVRVKSGHSLAPTPAESLAATPLQMDAKTHGKMTRGKLAPEARIDLHGLTLAEAHPDLIRFVLNAQSAGLRLVLVITGKGKLRDDTGPIPQRMGALRHQVPQWLRMAPLGHAVLQVTEAHLKHGGSGAYYVYLRRR